MWKFGRKLLAVLTAGVLTMCGMPVVSAEDAAAEQESEYPINFEIGTSWASPGKINKLEVNVTSDGTVSAASQGFMFRMELPDATADLLSFPSCWENWVDDTYYMLGLFDASAFQTSSVGIDSEQRISAIALNYDGRTATDLTTISDMLTLLFAIPDADTVKTVAESYDLPLQTGTHDGETVQYYSFPVNFADRDVTYTRSDGATSPGFQFLSSTADEYVDIMDQVGLKGGCINVIVAEGDVATTTTTTATTTKTTTKSAATTTSSQVQTTTKPAVTTTVAKATTAVTTATTARSTSTSAKSTTAATFSTTTAATIISTTTTTEIEYPIYLEIGTDWIAAGEDGEIGVHVTSDDTIDAASCGISLQLEFPDETAKLLNFPDSWNSTGGTYWTYSTSGRLVDGKLLGMWGDSAYPVDPTADDIFTLYYAVPDADTVQAVAKAYNISLQTGEHDGKAVQYYSFPLNFADRDTTITRSVTDGKESTSKVFQYIDPDAEDIMEQVGLKNGCIHVIVAEGSAVTTTAATPGDTTTTTTASGFTIALPADASLVAGASIQLESSVPASTLTWFSSDKSIATVDSEGMVTLLKSGTVSIIATDKKQIHSVVLEVTDSAATTTVITTTAAPTTETATTTATAVSTATDTTGSTSDSSSSYSILYGDLNLDGRVALIDAVLLSKASADAVSLSDTARANGDCNADGVTDGTDIIVLLQFLVKVIDRLPYSE